MKNKQKLLLIKVVGNASILGVIVLSLFLFFSLVNDSKAKANDRVLSLVQQVDAKATEYSGLGMFWDEVCQDTNQGKFIANEREYKTVIKGGWGTKLPCYMELYQMIDGQFQLVADEKNRR